MKVHHTPNNHTHPTATPWWTHDTVSNSLVHFSGYYVPLALNDLSFWLGHAGDKQWARDEDLRQLAEAYSAATMGAA
ncbi:MAG: hypothetical protein O3A33_14285 [Chloroflexi bacterium]|nr:hypothetical protein [Chloroflexota bacterium]